MTSQTGTQTIILNILPDILKSKDNNTMKLGQLIEYKMRNIFLQKSYKKWGWETSSGPLFLFKKNFIWGKSKWLAPYF